MTYNEAPPGWVKVPLREICLPVDRAGPNGYPDTRFRYIDIGSVSGRDHKIHSADWIEAESAPGRAQQIVQHNDVLYSTVRPYLRKIAHVPAELEGHVASTGFAVIRPHPEIDSRYIFYVVQSSQFEQQLFPKQRGVSYPAVRDGDVFDTVVPLPPIAEQRRIVEAIEDHLSRLDVAMDLVKKAKQRVKPFLASTLNRVVLGARLFDMGEQPPGGNSDRLLVGHSSKRFDYSELPSLPEGWLWRRSSDVCTFIGSGSTPKHHLMHPGSGEVPFLKVYNITQDGHVDFTIRPTFVDRETHDNLLKRSRVLPGDVLTNIVGPPLGKTAVVPENYPEWNINQAIVAFRAGREVQPGWLALVLRSPFVLNMLKKTAKATAGQFNIALSTCRDLPLPIPPMDAQQDLIASSTEQLEASDRLTLQIAPVILRASNLRRAILKQAFAGQLTAQSAADEPAYMFLNRVQVERNTQPSKRRRTTRRKHNVGPAIDAQAPPVSNSLSIPTVAIQQELPF